MRYKILAGVMLVGVGCGTSTMLASRSKPSSPLPEPTSRPNNPEFRGGKLESCYSFTSIDAGVMTGVCDDSRRQMTLTLSDAGADPCPQARSDAGWSGDLSSYHLYTVSNDDGVDMCEGAVYNATINEIDETCKTSDIHQIDGKALVVPGYWDRDGEYHAENYTISCMDGVVAKCAHWGYLPDCSYRPPARGSETALLDYYKACVRAARASYSDKNKRRSFTCNGAVIDIYDSLGIQTMTAPGPRKLDPRNKPMSCESTWAGDGNSGALLQLIRPRYEFFQDATDEPEVITSPDAGCDSGILRIQSFSQKAPRCEQSIGIGSGDAGCLGVSGEEIVEVTPCTAHPQEFSLINLVDVYALQVHDELWVNGAAPSCLGVNEPIAVDARVVRTSCRRGNVLQFEMRAVEGASDLYKFQISNSDGSCPGGGASCCVGVAPNAGTESPVVLQKCDEKNLHQQFHFVF